MTGTDLARRVIDPVTAQVTDLDGPTDQLARFLSDLRDVESQLRAAKRAVTVEVLDRLDKLACWTLTLDGLKVSSRSPEPSEEWNGPALREALLDLVEEGLLGIEAVDAAVETVVTYVPRKGGIRQLRKLGGRVAELVNEHATVVEKDRYVTVRPLV